MNAGKSHANQVQLIFEVMGYSPKQNLGFELSAEATSFLEKRCRSRGQALTTVIPDASLEALRLVDKLLSVDPQARPTAAQALSFEFLQDAETLCEYDKKYLSRPAKQLFDFEQEKYSLDELKRLIIGEVRISELSNQSIKAKLGIINSESNGGGEILSPPSSSLASKPLAAATAVRRLSSDEVGGTKGVSHATTATSSSTSSMSSATTPRIGTIAAVYQSTMMNRAGNTNQPTTSTVLPNINGGVLQSLASAALRAPKTPSPKKMDMILQKGQRAKRSSLEPGHAGMNVNTPQQQQQACEDRGEEMLAERPRPAGTGVASAVAAVAVAEQMKMQQRHSVGTIKPQFTKPHITSGLWHGGIEPATHNERGGLLPPPAAGQGLAQLLSQFSNKYQQGGDRMTHQRTISSSSSSSSSTSQGILTRPIQNPRLAGMNNMNKAP